MRRIVVAVFAPDRHASLPGGRIEFFSESSPESESMNIDSRTKQLITTFVRGSGSIQDPRHSRYILVASNSWTAAPKLLSRKLRVANTSPDAVSLGQDSESFREPGCYGLEKGRSRAFIAALNQRRSAHGVRFAAPTR